MTNALFGFDDRARGEQAAAAVRNAAPPTTIVEVHTNESIEQHARARAVDEQVTGGLLTNLRDLFQGVFEWSASPHPEAASFEETLRRGGSVVSVSTEDRADCARIDKLLDDTPCDRRTVWREPGRSDAMA